MAPCTTTSPSSPAMFFPSFFFLHRCNFISENKLVSRNYIETVAETAFELAIKLRADTKWYGHFRVIVFKRKILQWLFVTEDCSLIKFYAIHSDFFFSFFAVFDAPVTSSIRRYSFHRHVSNVSLRTYLHGPALLRKQFNRNLINDVGWLPLVFVFPSPSSLPSDSPLAPRNMQN